MAQHSSELGADCPWAASNMFSVSGRLRHRDAHRQRAGAVHPRVNGPARALLVLAREGEHRLRERRRANWKRAFGTPGHELNVQPPVLARLGRRGVLPERGISRPHRHGRRRTSTRPENTLPLSVDYTRPLRERPARAGRASSSGAGCPSRTTVERGNQSVIYPGIGDCTDWDEDIVARYGNLVRVKDKYTLEAGLRVEQTERRHTRCPAENIYYADRRRVRPISKLFPNVKLTYALGRAPPGHRRVQSADRPPRRAGAANLPEVRRPRAPQGRQSVSAATAHTRHRARRRPLVERRLDPWRPAIVGTSRTRSSASSPSTSRIRTTTSSTGSTRTSAARLQTGVELVGEHQLASPWQLSASVNWYVIDIDALQTTLLFPTQRPFAIPASRDDSWASTINNRFKLPRAAELQLSHVYYSARNVPQGRERARSSLDLSASRPLRNKRAELVFTFPDMFNDFGVRRDVDGEGFQGVVREPARDAGRDAADEVAVLAARGCTGDARVRSSSNRNVFHAETRRHGGGTETAPGARQAGCGPQSLPLGVVDGEERALRSEQLDAESGSPRSLGSLRALRVNHVAVRTANCRCSALAVLRPRARTQRRGGPGRRRPSPAHAHQRSRRCETSLHETVPVEQAARVHVDAHPPTGEASQQRVEQSLRESRGRY